MANDIVRASVRFIDPDSRDTGSWRAAKPKHHVCICEALRKHTRLQSDWWSLRLELGPTYKGVQGHNPQKRTYNALDLSQQRTLQSLLSNSGKDWTSFAKLTLAVMISYSLYYLYGSIWASGRWSRLNIIFFSDGRRTPLRPFLSSDPAKLRGPLSDPDGQHQYPELLELGIILLEIHLGRSLESFLGHREKISSYDDLWLESQRAFDLRRLHIESLVHREAIKRCLSPTFSMSGTYDAETLRMTIYREIVKPLEDELIKNFGDEFASFQSLDDTAEQRIDLASSATDFTVPTWATVATRAPQVLHSVRETHHESSQLERSVLMDMRKEPTHDSPQTPCELFGEEDQEQPTAPLARQ